MEKPKIGDKLKSECIACSKEEIWEVIGKTKEKYLDGEFDCYEIRAIENCMGAGVRTSIKDCPEGWAEYEILSP